MITADPGSIDLSFALNSLPSASQLTQRSFECSDWSTSSTQPRAVGYFHYNPSHELNPTEPYGRSTSGDLISQWITLITMSFSIQ